MENYYSPLTNSNSNYPTNNNNNYIQSQSTTYYTNNENQQTTNSNNNNNNNQNWLIPHPFATPSQPQSTTIHYPLTHLTPTYTPSPLLPHSSISLPATTKSRPQKSTTQTSKQLLAPDYPINPAGPASNSNTIFKCPKCSKIYKGKHARSIWRRHLQDKHGIPLAMQPRRTRWDNDANRPKSEEERRARTLDSKRRWARKHRAERSGEKYIEGEFDDDLLDEGEIDEADLADWREEDDSGDEGGEGDYANYNGERMEEVPQSHQIVQQKIEKQPVLVASTSTGTTTSGSGRGRGRPSGISRNPSSSSISNLPSSTSTDNLIPLQQSQSQSYDNNNRVPLHHRDPNSYSSQSQQQSQQQPIYDTYSVPPLPHYQQHQQHQQVQQQPQFYSAQPRLGTRIPQPSWAISSATQQQQQQQQSHHQQQQQQQHYQSNSTFNNPIASTSTSSSTTNGNGQYYIRPPPVPIQSLSTIEGRASISNLLPPPPHSRTIFEQHHSTTSSSNTSGTGTGSYNASNPSITSSSTSSASLYARYNNSHNSNNNNTKNNGSGSTILRSPVRLASLGNTNAIGGRGAKTIEAKKSDAACVLLALKSGGSSPPVRDLRDNAVNSKTTTTTNTTIVTSFNNRRLAGESDYDDDEIEEEEEEEEGNSSRRTNEDELEGVERDGEQEEGEADGDTSRESFGFENDEIELRHQARMNQLNNNNVQMNIRNKRAASTSPPLPDEDEDEDELERGGSLHHQHRPSPKKVRGIDMNSHQQQSSNHHHSTSTTPSSSNTTATAAGIRPASYNVYTSFVATPTPAMRRAMQSSPAIRGEGEEELTLEGGGGGGEEEEFEERRGGDGGVSLSRGVRESSLSPCGPMGRSSRSSTTAFESESESTSKLNDVNHPSSSSGGGDMGPPHPGSSSSAASFNLSTPAGPSRDSFRPFTNFNSSASQTLPSSGSKPTSIQLQQSQQSNLPQISNLDYYSSLAQPHHLRLTTNPSSRHNYLNSSPPGASNPYFFSSPAHPSISKQLGLSALPGPGFLTNTRGGVLGLEEEIKLGGAGGAGEFGGIEEEDESDVEIEEVGIRRRGD